jgi:hypothetical protein
MYAPQRNRRNRAAGSAIDQRSRYRADSSAPGPWGPGRGQMDKSVDVVVEGFRNLTSEQQVRAWIEIEEIWKSPSGHGSEPEPDPTALSLGDGFSRLPSD